MSPALELPPASACRRRYPCLQSRNTLLTCARCMHERWEGRDCRQPSVRRNWQRSKRRRNRHGFRTEDAPSRSKVLELPAREPDKLL